VSRKARRLAFTVRSAPLGSSLLAGVITLLGLADGVLHLSLDFILFRGNVFGSLAPPPGAPPSGGGPPPFPLPLNQLFALNLIGYVVLVLIFWFGAPRLGRRRWIVDVLFILYVAVIFIGWLRIGGPNPMGLGYLSKAMEIVLVVALLAHMWALAGRSQNVSTAQA
jgi:hypothetical protein